MTTVGERLRKLREARGWSQAEVARRAGITQPSVSAYERGRGLPFEMALRLCRVFEIEAEQLTRTERKRA